MTSTNPYEDPASRPLFGEHQPQDRVLNLVVGIVTSIIVLETLVSAFVFPGWPPNGVNVFFAVIIVFICCSLIMLIYWYRQGDLEPKFRKMIYFNSLTIVLLCICGNLYFQGLGDKKK
ncbi:hypothetical protein ACJMK2_016754 [Sinanodonta woodiana]|uniref:Transmembrane protein 243 n=1 Tax=Sinanodonta woodiana TaxID=1069815 RepID=A0ABD3UUR0_SINWO